MLQGQVRGRYLGVRLPSTGMAWPLRPLKQQDGALLLHIGRDRDDGIEQDSRYKEKLFID